MNIGFGTLINTGNLLAEMSDAVFWAAAQVILRVNGKVTLAV